MPRDQRNVPSLQASGAPARSVRPRSPGGIWGSHRWGKLGGRRGSCGRSNTSSARLASFRARNSPSFVSGFLSAIGRLGTPRSKGTRDLASSTSCWRKLTPTLRKAGRGSFEAPRLSAVLGALPSPARGGPLPCRKELRPCSRRTLDIRRFTSSASVRCGPCALARITGLWGMMSRTEFSGSGLAPTLNMTGSSANNHWRGP